MAVAAAQGCGGEALPPTLPVADPMVCPKIWNWTSYLNDQRPIQLASGVNLDDLRSQLTMTLHEANEAARDSLIRALVDTVFLSGPGETQNTAEFHDCQAFITEPRIAASEHYSSGILAIFAVRNRDPALVDSALVEDTLFGFAAGRGEALPAAQIFALADYPALDIQQGFSCLYLLKRGDLWEVGLRPDQWNELDCRQPISAEDFLELKQERPGLTVTRRTGRSWRDYPVVARWHWAYDTAQGSQEYKMGVWCDQGWCEVGRPGTEAPTESFALETLAGGVATFADGTPILDAAQGQVPGWYDEQILSTYRAGNLAVSDVVGTIIPDPRLGQYTDHSYDTASWLPAAMVALTPLNRTRDPDPFLNPGPNPFAEKLGLVFTPKTGPLNAVSLCRGEWETRCGEDGAPADPPPCDPEMVHTDTLFKWWAKVEPATMPHATVTYHCVARCPYPFQVAGTARWRWLPDDPGMWMRCIDGCCEVRGGEEE